MTAADTVAADADAPTTDTDVSVPDGEVRDERDIRALREYISVLPETGRVKGADDLYLVVTESGSEYLVDARGRACECPDHEYRETYCKHLRAVDFATGRRPIPSVVDVREDFGQHVDAEARRERLREHARMHADGRGGGR